MEFWRPQEVPSLELAQGTSKRRLFLPPFSLSKSGSSEAFLRGRLCHVGHLTKRTQPPCPNMSALLPAHHLTPRCPHFCPGLLSASVYRSSKTVGRTEQTTLELLQCPILGLSEGQTQTGGQGRKEAKAFESTGKGEKLGGGHWRPLVLVVQGADSAEEGLGRVLACHCSGPQSPVCPGVMARAPPP